MITRFDHAVIGVRDLDEAIRHYRSLGFDVSPGGRHTGLGTHNAIVRFGLDYLELISIYDESEVDARGFGGKVLFEFLQKREGGLLGYALATTDIQQDAEHFQRVGLAAQGPFAMQRMRPDGRLLSWRLLVPGGVSWRQPWPFLIQWDIPDEQRLSWEKPGTHPNGVTGWTGIAIAVRNLESAIDLYQRQLGLAFAQRGEAPHLASQRASFHIGTSRIDLLMPTGEGPVQQMLEEVGEGPFEVTLAVRDLNQAREVLQQGGMSPESGSEDPGTLILPLHQTLGARLVLTEGKSCG
jgi:catechol 2,3-dioxygenase-like lactoylglutathione lyase family enzyme